MVRAISNLESYRHWLGQLLSTPRHRHAPVHHVKLEPLEARRLMNVDWGSREQSGCACCGGAICACGLPGLVADPVIDDGVDAALEEPLGALHSLSSIPVLNSNLGATASIYLDFNGHTEPQWGSYANVTTPVFSTDSDFTTFSDAEISAMTDIWKRVAEDYAPFNINVTTVLPASFANKTALRVSIGGGGGWYGNAGGVAYRDSYTSSIVNTVYVFSDKLGKNAKYIAEATSHEAGHAFGLAHQSLYDANGNFVESYHPGSGGWAPIMGVSYYAGRSTFHNGTTYANNVYQDDMAVIARTVNGFGYRADDHGNGVSTATALAVSGTAVSGGGIIEQTSDTDYFSFSTSGGTISLAVNVVTVGANLDARLELRSATGTLIASAAPTNTLGATIVQNVAAGSYRLVVASHGNYGDVGQYTVSGTIVVGNSAPVAKNDSYSMLANSTLTVSAAGGVLNNDTDADGPSALTAGLVSGPASGTLSLSGNGSFVYTASSNFTGTVTFVYRAYDGQKYSANTTVSIVVSAGNVGPAAVNDTATTMRKSQVKINVLANDSDADGLNFSSVVIVTGPANGSILEVSSSGTVTYKPTGKYMGADSFTYRVRDTQGLLSNVATVNITVTDTPHGAAGRWVQTLYDTVLGREAALSEVNYWGSIIAQGVTSESIAYSFINSRERRAGIIDSYYVDYLGRRADQDGINFWIGVWDENRGPEAVRAGLIGSKEYFNSHGGTASGAIQGLYFDILGRGAATHEIEYWSSSLSKTTLTQVAMGFVTSDEYRLGIINGWYVDYLARNCDTSGARYWLQQMKSGTTQANIQAQLLTSNEVWNNS